MYHGHHLLPNQRTVFVSLDRDHGLRTRSGKEKL